MYRLVLHEKELHFNMTVNNTGKDLSFRFMLSLNTYLKVPDVTQCELLGVQGCSYIDTNDGEKHKQEEEYFKINRYTDLYFIDGPNEFFITNAMSGHKYRIETKNAPAIIAWNSWSDQTKLLKDLSDEEYSKFFYFGVGVVDKLFSLGPGESFEAKMLLCNCKKVSVSND